MLYVNIYCVDLSMYMCQCMCVYLCVHAYIHTYVCLSANASNLRPTLYSFLIHSDAVTSSGLMFHQPTAELSNHK